MIYKEEDLPTPAQMLARARAELWQIKLLVDRLDAAYEDVGGWLRSDWQPLGSNFPAYLQGYRSAVDSSRTELGRLIGQLQTACHKLPEAPSAVDDAPEWHDPADRTEDQQ